MTGSQQNFEEAQLITCLLREDLETRAREQDQVLLVAAALAETGPNDCLSNAERVFLGRILEIREECGFKGLFSPASCIQSADSSIRIAFAADNLS